MNSPISLKEEVSLKLVHFAHSFKEYPNSEESYRRRLVIDIRKALHQLKNEYSSDDPLKPPKLEVYQQDILRKTELINSLKLDSPITELKGVGAKIYEKLIPKAIMFWINFSIPLGSDFEGIWEAKLEPCWL